MILGCFWPMRKSIVGRLSWDNDRYRFWTYNDLTMQSVSNSPCVEWQERSEYWCKKECMLFPVRVSLNLMLKWKWSFTLILGDEKIKNDRIRQKFDALRSFLNFAWTANTQMIEVQLLVIITLTIRQINEATVTNDVFQCGFLWDTKISFESRLLLAFWSFFRLLVSFRDTYELKDADSVNRKSRACGTTEETISCDNSTWITRATHKLRLFCRPSKMYDG